MARELRASREDLTQRWLERILARVSVAPNQVFPTESLLDHVPLLIDGVADYLENPANEVTADIPVVAKAMELGALRYEQGFDAYEIMKEYEILGGILFNHLILAVERTDAPCGKGELLVCGHRLFRAISLIQQATTNHYLRLAGEQIAEREQRLRAFNRAVSHEFKNRIGAALGAADLLDLPDLDDKQRTRFVGMVARNVKEMRDTLDKLLELTKMEVDSRQQKHVKLPQVVAEVVRQLREAIQARDIDVRVSEDLPDLDVNAAAVELCLTNYLTNAIKYADPEKQHRWVEIRAATEPDDPNAKCEIVVRVHDNGRGVPEEARVKLFERFFRAHAMTVTGVEGTGLGLSIVRETMEAIGGRAWAEFPEEGCVFALALPCRRESDVGQE